MREMLRAHPARGRKNRVYQSGGTPFHITVSLGVANYQPNKSLQENIMVADGALYQSKHNGRNRTTSV